MMQAVWGIVRVRISRLLIVIDSIWTKSKFQLMADEARSAGRLQGSAPKKDAAVMATATSVWWYSLIKMLSSALELHPVIEQYLNIVTEGKLK
jgi:hypothetical protein